ncbi:MAG TPA: acyl-CoA dehydrogenase family protein [Syntrophomonas sp.]|nr:acyl-CoA dehydrogenase family protein [Syntrophomonas sp.]
MIGFEMTEAQKELIGRLKEVLNAKVRPYALAMDVRCKDEFDWRFIEVLAENNLIAPIIASEYGGRELSYVSLALAIEEIAAACAGLSACMVGTLHAILPIIIGGTREQKEQYLPLFVSTQPALASFALTEPKGGSDIENMETVYQSADGYYHISGVKDYVINGALADFVTVCANSKGSNQRNKFQFFIVPKDQVKVNKIRKTMGINYSNTSQLAFEDTVVSEKNIIGHYDNAYLLLNQTLDIGRAMIGAIEVGIARAAYEMVLKYAQEREQFGRPIFSNQGVSFPIVRMSTEIDAARFMVWRACSFIDHEGDYTQASSMAKVFASKVGQSVTSTAIDIMGAAGYIDDNLLNMYYRDAKVCSIVGGTDNIQQMIIASLL